MGLPIVTFNDVVDIGDDESTIASPISENVKAGGFFVAFEGTKDASQILEYPAANVSLTVRCNGKGVARQGDLLTDDDSSTTGIVSVSQVTTVLVE